MIRRLNINYQPLLVTSLNLYKNVTTNSWMDLNNVRQQSSRRVALALIELGLHDISPQ
jgi:hypothetical protein